MDNSIVVDTCVLVDACTEEGDCTMDCLTIFAEINKGAVQLGVDSGDEILDEYKKTLIGLGDNTIAKIIRKYLAKERWRATGERRIKTYIPIREDRVADLLSKGFHDDDIKFVRIAPLTGLRTIFSSDERSFLNHTYSSWLQENLGVDTKRPSDFPSYISHISRP